MAAAVLRLNADDQDRALFDRVTSQLDLQGTKLQYYNIDGMPEAVAEWATQVWLEVARQQQMPFALDFVNISQSLGLERLDAAGASTVALEDGFYQHRTFLHWSDGSQPPTILQTLGENQPFIAPELVPAGADWVLEVQPDYQPVLQAVNAIATNMMGEYGPQLIALQLDQERAPGFTIRELLELSRHRAVAWMTYHPDEPAIEWEPDMPAMTPFDITVRLLGAAETATQHEAQLREAAEGVMDANGWTVYHFASEGPVRPALLVSQQADGDLVFTTGSPEDIISHRAGAKLKDDADFQHLLHGRAPEGVALQYSSPEYEQIVTAYLHEAIAQQDAGTISPAAMEGVLNAFYQPMLRRKVTLQRLTADGWAYDEFGTSASGINLQFSSPVAVGLLAAMAIPAFQAVRVSSQAGAAEDNLKQIAQTGMRYNIENGVSSVDYPTLVDEGYLRPIEPVAGEDYSELVVYEDGGQLFVQFTDGTPVSWMY
ncbi:MAG: hypothetical protein E1N59_3362 [Puniceicoccaceae bacterium 5H]|nr:MAG: hypothetical protein E1N59_3362 [Puniceicoccaceae bacterium 5H]